MRRYLLSACALCALVFSPAAHAAGGAADALNYSWTGLYGGINAGYGWGNSDWDFAGGAGSTSTHDNSGVVGVQVGYDAQVGENLFAGIELSLDASNIDGKSRCGGASCETHVSSIGDASVRLGLAQGRGLFYVKGGLAYQDTTHHLISPGLDYHDGGGEQFGYLLGGGIEYAMMYNITGKIEYNYLGFSSNDSRINNTTSINATEPLNIVKVGFNFKFE